MSDDQFIPNFRSMTVDRKGDFEFASSGCGCCTEFYGTDEDVYYEDIPWDASTIMAAFDQHITQLYQDIESAKIARAAWLLRNPSQ